MKKTISRLMAPALMGCVLLFGIVGCTSQQQAQLAVLAANAKAKAANACMVIQPTLVDLAAAQPTNTTLATFRDDNAKLCAAVTSLDATSVQSLVNTSIPQLITLTNLLPIDPAQKSAIQLALTAASIALSNWLTVYGQTETSLATVPASGVAVPAVATPGTAGSAVPAVATPLGNGTVLQ